MKSHCLIQTEPCIKNENLRRQGINEKKIILFGLGLAFLFILRDIFAVEIPLSFFIIYCGIALFFTTNKDELFSFIFFYIPFSNGMRLTYVIGIAMILSFIKGKLDIKSFLKLFLITALLIVYEGMHAFLQFENIHFDLIRYFQLAINLLFLAITLSQENLKYHSICKFYVFGLLMTCTILLLITLQNFNFNIYAFFDSGLRFGNPKHSFDIEFVLSNNQNMIALHCLIGISITFLLYNETKKKGYLLSLLLLSLFGFMTGSRTFILVYMGLFFYIIGILMLYNKVNQALIYLAYFVFGGIILFLIFNDVFLGLINRFKEADITGGRMKLNSLYFNYFISDVRNFLFGIGIQNMVDKTGFPNSSHNATIEILTAWGFIGLIIVIILFINVFKTIKTKIEKQFILFKLLPIIAFMVFVQSIQLFSVNELVSLVTVSSVACMISREQLLETNKEC